MFCEIKGRNCYLEKDMEFLVNICNLISHSEDLYGNLELLMNDLCTFFNVRYSMMTIVDNVRGQIMLSASHGLSDEEKSKVIYRIGEGVTGQVIATGEPIVIPDISKEKRFLNKTGAGKPVHKNSVMAFVCVPVIIKNEPVGTLSIHKEHDGKRNFEYDVKFLNIVATLIGKNLSIHRKHIEELEELRKENRRLQNGKPFKPDNIVGNSSLMNDLYQLIERVSPTNSTVMIRGESGVGKELIAEAIHKASPRATKPFIKVNCSALPETLIESELFGHEKGSFTGADRSHTGRFEMADGGTIFLDEIGDVPLSIQVKLLRVLQQRQFERIGGNKTITVDVRIITATNRNLEEMIKNNAFREDFYWRINVFPIYVPALRERKADITILTDHFINKINKQNNMHVKRITGGALDLLMLYSWPGNIRELENVIERAMIMTTDEVIHSYNLPPTLQTAVSSDTVHKGSLEMVLGKAEKQMITDAMIVCMGNMSKAAAQLGITERIMRLRVKKYGLNPQNYTSLSGDK
jgi:Nif-specific regulatory protein